MSKDLDKDKAKGFAAPTVDNGSDGSLPDGSRRRFTRAGLVVPVIMTLSSRPVWARNCTDSAVLSGNLSDIDEFGECGGEGCSADFWAAASDQQYGINHGANRSFESVFITNAFPGKTLRDVVTGVLPADTSAPAACNSTDCQTALVLFGQQIVAALENASTAVAFELTVSDVIDQFNLIYSGATAPSDFEDAAILLADNFNNRTCPL